MLKWIKNKIEHGLNCWINMNNTELLENDYLWLWYQIIRCMECWKKYIIFRSNWNVFQEHFNDEMVKYLVDFSYTINDYNNWVSELKSNQITVMSNIEDIINYPIWGEDIIIYSTYDKYWTEKIINMPFYEAINLIRPN